MKTEFPGYFASNEDDIEALWADCLFVLDTNVLLSLYRYSDATRAELLKVFNSLAERLWVPHQVAQEYLTNRLAVIGEQAKAYEDSVRKIDAIRKGFENSNYHPFVSVETLSECVSVFDKLVEELNLNRVAHEGRISLDEIKDHLESLLEGKVGKGFDRAKLEQIIAQGEVRYEQKVPPGYCDAKKGGDSKIFADQCKPYGDYIVWLQIIEHAKQSGRAVIFVTGDSKDDWWMSFQGRTVGPRPQLIEEFLFETNKLFYMYSPDRFLERANSYLQQDTSPEAMIEIQSLRDEESEEFTFEPSMYGVSSNSSRSELKDGFPPASDSIWSENYERLNEVVNLRESLTDKAFTIKEELRKAKNYHKLILLPYSSRGVEYSDVLKGERLDAFDSKVARSKKRINQLEDELIGLRAEVSALIEFQKSLVSSS